MAAPTRDWIPAPPLPEFYKAASEGAAKEIASSKASSHSSRSKSKHCAEESLPPPRLDRPSKQASTPGPAAHAVPLVQYPGVSLDATGAIELPKKLPPPPPGVTTIEASGMAYHYTHHYHHAGHPHNQATYTYHTSKPVVIVPPPPPTYQPWAATLPQQQQQLTTVHVCRICCRPRSEKYHLQNPIAPGEVPPPPDICRRCRVKNVEERVVQVEKIQQSSPIKLGVACLVSDDRFVTKEKAMETTEQARAQSGRRERSAVRERERSREVKYRYVRVREPSAPPSPVQPAQVSVENLETMNLMNDRLFAEGQSDRKSTTTKYTIQAAEPPPIPGLSTATSLRVSKVEKVDSSQASTLAKGSEPARQRPQSTKVVETETKTAVAPSHGSKLDRNIRLGHTDSEIRKIAREEVERYRHAERLMTAHPHAYAHGRSVEIKRTVPVERRIEIQTDASEPKPWENPPMPAMGPVPSVTRSVKAPSTTKTQREPSEDSRLWYHQPGSDHTSRKTNLWADSDHPATDRGRRTERTYEREVEVVTRRSVSNDRGQPGGKPSERREVIEVIRISPPSDVHSRISSKHHGSTRSVKSGASPVSSRVKELRGGEEQRERHHPGEHDAASTTTTAGRAPFAPVDRDDWEQAAPSKAATRVSSVRQGSYVQRSEHGTVEMPSPRQYIRVGRPQPPARSDGTWYAERVDQVGIQQQQSGRSSRRQEDDDNTVWPGEQPTRPAASERTSTVKGNWDWEYTERIVQPADRPLGSKPFDEQHPPRWISDSERLLTRSSVLAPSARSTIVSTSQAPKLKSEPLAAPPTTKSPPARGRGPYMQRFSDESVHVRFASKVEFSPTPPGSDEYLPEQVPQRRDQRRVERRSGLRYQVDGPDDRESAEDLINEYEARRAGSQALTPESEQEYDYVYARGSAPGRCESEQGLEMHGAVPVPRAPSLRGGGFKRGPLNDADEKEERHNALSRQTRRASPDDTETATLPIQDRPLTFALSESPSREKLRQDFLRHESEDKREEDEQTEYRLRGRTDSRVRDDFDNKGPYRIEERSESMDASCGSGHGGPSMSRRRESSRRRTLFAVRERR